jgi:hypothetical protein
LILALLWGISTAWQFSIGYFASAIAPPFIVGITEVVSKGRFLIRETESPKKITELLLVANTME